MSNALILIVNLLNLFLRQIRQHDDCPDGVCEPVIAEAGSVEANLRAPNVDVSFGLFDFVKFLRCFPTDRVFAVLKRIAELIKGCGQCPEGDCSFFDILGCLDLQEAVDIVREILAIIQDAYICDGEGDGEITLGQAAGE